jgi:hypothetical protein
MGAQLMETNYQAMQDRYTISDWNAVISLHRADIVRLQARYGSQAGIAWVGEEIDILRLRIQQAETRKAALIALANGDDNANF